MAIGVLAARLDCAGAAQLMLTNQPLVDQMDNDGANAKMTQFLDFVQGVRAKVRRCLARTLL